MHTEDWSKCVHCHPVQTSLTLDSYSCLPEEEVTNIENVVQDIIQELVDSQVKTNGLICQLHTELSNNHQKADRLAKILFTHQQKHYCEFLYTKAHVIDTAQSLLMIMGSKSEDVIVYWIPGMFQHHKVDNGIWFYHQASQGNASQN